MAALGEMVDWLDGYLRIDEVEDYPGALNGLQVENRAPVSRVAGATDACQATIDAAAEAGCQLLLVHHGLFWGETRRLTGPAYRRVRRLIEADLALYSAHLPLDLHPEIGNNALLAAALDLPVAERFGRVRSLVGIGVLCEADLSRETLVARVAEACGSDPFLIAGGSERVTRLAIVTGGGGSLVGEAAAAGADTLLTGEGSHHTFHEAVELGLNVLFAGHYATETLGVRALAEEVASRFGLEWEFLDVPTGL